MYLDSICGQTIYGLTEKFKFSTAALTVRGRRGPQVLHLSTAKPVIITKDIPFEAVYPGTRVEVGEFSYVSRNGYLTVTNLTSASGGTEGIEVDSPDDFAIPISYIASERIVVTTFEHRPEIL